jgi:hypothetical protein
MAKKNVAVHKHLAAFGSHVRKAREKKELTETGIALRGESNASSSSMLRTS